MLHDHAELAGTGAARGGDPGEVRREAHPMSIPKLQRRSTVAPFMQPALSASSAVWLVAVEPAFDYHLLEKRKLLEAAACECTLQMQPSARPVYPRACRPRSTCSSGLACHPHACCACPSAAPQVCRLCPKGRSPPRLT